MTFEEIRKEMLAFDPIARRIRKFIKVNGVSDSSAVEALTVNESSQARRR